MKVNEFYDCENTTETTNDSEMDDDHLKCF